MKKIHLTLLALAGGLMICEAHGPGHVHRNQSAEVGQVLDEQGPAPVAGTPSASAVSPTGKSFKEPLVEKSGPDWGASLTTGWESRHVHYGVNETGNGGAWTTEVAVSIDNLALSAWSGFGLGNNFEEWNFTASYYVEAGPVFFIPGYNFRYAPGYAEESHSHGGHEDEHGHGEEHGEEHGHEEEEGASHAHLLYNNELFAVLGTNAIPYITPSAAFIWNLNDAPGGFLEFRIDGDVPVWKDIVTLEPYALLGLNFGYNTTDSYGWNNFQFGLQGNWQVTKLLTAFAGVNYSVAMTALQDIDQGNEFWVNAGVSVGF